MYRIAAASALLLAAASTGQGLVALKPGEAVTLVIDDGGRILVDERSKAKLSKFDKASTDRLLRSGSDYPTGPNVAYLMPGEPGVPNPKAVAPAQILVKFAEYPAGHRMLFIENGYDRALTYRARIGAGDKSAATDVCTVLPLKRGQEHWPYRIDTIELSQLKLIPWKEGDAVTCE